MGTSHLVMGELSDFLTGCILPDTHDERLLQKISKFLIEEKGYLKEDILSRKKLTLTVDGKTGTVTVHFIIRINGISAIAVMYGPGSIVTRQRPTLAVARLFEKYVIPYAVITNGHDANLMETKSGKVIGKDLDAVFSRKETINVLKAIEPETLSAERREKEQRILYTMDILTEAECTEFVCKIR